MGKPKKINHEYKKQKKIDKLNRRKEPLNKKLNTITIELKKFNYTPPAWNTSWKESPYVTALKHDAEDLKQQINLLNVEITKVR